ncbi:hypothetical protein GCM10027189_35870 [Rufibacter soli]
MGSFQLPFFCWKEWLLNGGKVEAKEVYKLTQRQATSYARAKLAAEKWKPVLSLFFKKQA